MNRVFLTIVLLTLASLLATETALADPIPTVVYREIFPNGTGVAISTSTNPNQWVSTGWDGYQGADGHQMLGGAYSTTGWYVPQHDTVDTRTGIANIGINSKACCSTLGGYLGLLAAGSFTSDPVLLFTNEYSVDRSEWNVAKVEWWQTIGVNNSPGPASAVRVALKIGDDWYASDQSFATATSSGSGPHSLVFENAPWRPLTFSPGSELTLGLSTGALPGTGDISAFGYFVDSWTAGIRLDTYEMWAVPVPEPGGVTLLSLALVGLLFRRRRRTR